MSEAMPQAAPAKSGSGLKTILIIVAVVVLLGLLACGGLLGLIYYGAFVALPQAVKAQVQSSQVIQDEIGSIESISMDFTDTTRQAEAKQGQQVISFAVEGPKGSGHILAVQSPNNQNEFDSFTLVTSDGREIPISLDGAAAADTSLDTSDIDLGGDANPEPADPFGSPE